MSALVSLIPNQLHFDVIDCFDLSSTHFLEHTSIHLGSASSSFWQAQPLNAYIEQGLKCIDPWGVLRAKS